MITGWVEKSSRLPQELVRRRGDKISFSEEIKPALELPEEIFKKKLNAISIPSSFRKLESCGLETKNVLM